MSSDLHRAAELAARNEERRLRWRVRWINHWRNRHDEELYDVCHGREYEKGGETKTPGTGSACW